MEIRDSLKDPVPSQEGVGGDPTHPTPPTKNTFNCPKHPKEELMLFCETCGILICYKCALRGGEHHDHVYEEELGKAFEKQKKELEHSLKPMEEQLTIVNEALVQLDKRCGEITDQQAALEYNIHYSFRRLQETLDAKKTDLIGELHHMTQGKLKTAAVQRDQMETMQAQLSSCLNYVKEKLKTGSEKEVLKMNIENQVKELTLAYQPNVPEPNVEADMIFSAPVCQNYGRVYSSGSPDPSKCNVAEKSLKDVVFGERYTTVMHVFNCKGELRKEPPRSLECELVSEITGATVRGNVERKGLNKYTRSAISPQ